MICIYFSALLPTLWELLCLLAAMAMALQARAGPGQKWLSLNTLTASSSLSGTSLGRGFGFGEKNWKKWRRTVSHPVRSFALECDSVFVLWELSAWKCLSIILDSLRIRWVLKFIYRCHLVSWWGILSDSDVVEFLILSVGVCFGRALTVFHLLPGFWNYYLSGISQSPKENDVREWNIENSRSRTLVLDIESSSLQGDKGWLEDLILQNSCARILIREFVFPNMIDVQSRNIFRRITNNLGTLKLLSIRRSDLQCVFFACLHEPTGLYSDSWLVFWFNYRICGLFRVFFRF